MVKHDCTLLDCCNLRDNILHKWSRLLPMQCTQNCEKGGMKRQQFLYIEIPWGSVCKINWIRTERNGECAWRTGGTSACTKRPTLIVTLHIKSGKVCIIPLVHKFGSPAE